MLDKLKDNLTNVVAIIGVVGAIGAGFTVYGQMQEQINNLAGLDLNPLIKEISDQNIKIEKQNQKIAVLDKTIQVLELEIKELRASGKNPLAN
jgi:cell division protein FtsB|tara:strand:+ start:542 stop:820 length:279 start_codon:yes stop_codon:yes gene_type:complete